MYMDDAQELRGPLYPSLYDPRKVSVPEASAEDKVWIRRIIDEHPDWHATRICVAFRRALGREVSPFAVEVLLAEKKEGR